MTMFSANAEQEAWERHERCLGMEEPSPRFIVPDPVAYSHSANVSDDFATLGRMLAHMEREFRNVVEGTEEQRLLCSQRFTPETHELAGTIAEALGAFKRKAFAMSEEYTEKLG